MITIDDLHIDPGAFAEVDVFIAPRERTRCMASDPNSSSPLTAERSTNNKREKLSAFSPHLREKPLISGCRRRNLWPRSISANPSQRIIPMPHNTSPLAHLNHRFLAFECRATAGPQTGGALALKTNHGTAGFPDDPLRWQVILTVEFASKHPTRSSTKAAQPSPPSFRFTKPSRKRTAKP